MATVAIFQHNDKTPMIFCLRPCPIKKKVRQLIEKSGGFCFPSVLHVPPHYRKNAIVLVPDGEPIKEENSLRASYINDCVKAGQLLPQNDYRSNNDGSIKISVSGTEGRSSYTKTEDKHILLYVRQNTKKNTNLTGNSFWKKLESQNMLQLQGRSWQSMRDRYLKHLRGNESQYNLDVSTTGPLPMPPPVKKKNDIARGREEVCEKSFLDDDYFSRNDEAEGGFLAQIEARRDTLSPGLSPKEYESLIDEFVKSVQKAVDLDIKVIHKILFKCNGQEDVAKYYISHRAFPEGFHMVSDEGDKLLLRCLHNPDICDEGPAIRLAEELGRDVVLDRAAALIGVSRSDFEYMQQIPWDFKSFSASV